MFEPVKLAPDELLMFEKLRGMEKIHNEVAYNLSAYRDSVMEMRNEFVALLAKKYRLQKPSEVTFDPISQRLVSIFHPDLKGHKIIVDRSDAFKDLASKMMTQMFKELKVVLETTETR